ncbi:MAG TPA: slipin family protein [Candidatus Baltobacteraceae bacterium]|nr:slipin family protein [Candidatus Baltobacteraceae bacterium]
MKTYLGSSSAILIDILLAAVLAGLAWLGTSDLGSTAIVFVLSILILLGLSVRVVKEWNRMPVLRLGRYQGIIGPGLIVILPFIESTPTFVDLRVISTTFSAEQTLTKDNVPVNVDAILFWQVKDPENSILKVQSYINSVQLAAQTALRDKIGKSLLSEMLAGRDIIGDEIKSLIQERISDWGTNAISVELRDVKIPQELQDAMARVATSEREKMARVTLAESESLAADKMIDAAKKYQTNPYAMQLRALNMLYEMSLIGKNMMVFIPTESKGFSIPTPIGVAGLQDIMNMNLKKVQNATQQKAADNKAKKKMQPDEEEAKDEDGEQ